MKKTILLILSVTLLLSVSWSSATATPPVNRIKIANNPLTNANKVLKIRYYLQSKAIVGIKVTKNKRTIKLLRKARLQKKGRHIFRWNGRGKGNKLVPAGRYTLKIAIRNPKSRKLILKFAKITLKKSVRKRPSKPIEETPITTPPPSTPESNPLFSDYFDRPDGLIADNYGHSDPLNKWDVTSQSFYVKDNQGYTNSPVFRVRTYKNDFSNFILKADMKKMDRGIEAWEGLAVFIRYQDPYNLYIVSLRDDNKIHIKKKYNGIYTTLAIVPLDTSKLNYWYKIKVVANGNNIQAYVDDIKYLEINDSTFTSGRVGIRTDNIEAYFDNFEVWTQ